VPEFDIGESLGRRCESINKALELRESLSSFARWLHCLFVHDLPLKKAVDAGNGGRRIPEDCIANPWTNKYPTERTGFMFAAIVTRPVQFRNEFQAERGRCGNFPTGLSDSCY
jgi:hypothetical protein